MNMAFSEHLCNTPMSTRVILILLLIRLDNTVSTVLPNGTFSSTIGDLPGLVSSVQLHTVVNDELSMGMLHLYHSHILPSGKPEVTYDRAFIDMKTRPNTSIIDLQDAKPSDTPERTITLHDWTTRLCQVLVPTKSGKLASIIKPHQFSADDSDYEVQRDETTCSSFQLVAETKVKVELKVSCVEVLKHRRLPSQDPRSIRHRSSDWSIILGRETPV